MRTDFSTVTAPQSFVESVQKAARQAVLTPSRRRQRRVALVILAAGILLSGVAVAAMVNWVAADLFTEQKGFMLPAYEWGSSDQTPREDTIVFYEHTADITYQYENGGLIAVEMVFHRQNQPSDRIRTELYENILADMNRLYGEPLESRSGQNAGEAALQDILGEQLGLPVEQSEQERIREALLGAGADEALAERAAEAVEQSKQSGSMVQRWMDEKTNTAISLRAAYFSGEQEIRLITVSLSQLSQ